ncbi:MAG: hypothetical protein HKN12_08575 [Gemmatimonadetes bacterium]|nr:hypothetical protein [Gemmatimonadota bacterium]
MTSPEFRKLALAVLGSPNIASKRELFSHYDQEVQGRTFYRPGESDAGVALPVDGAPLAVLLSSDGNPRYGELDPYWGGANAVVEAVRNVVVSGGWPRALTDCLNFGNPENPEVYRDFRDAIIGLSEAARGIGTLELEDGSPLPFISGNVSLYNESSAGSAVPPSPIVCCLGVQAEATRTVGARLQESGNVLVLVGDRRVELGGSEAAWIIAGTDPERRLRGQVPTADFAAERKYARAVLGAIEGGRVQSGHDISSGGLLVALAEMMLGARGNVELGLDVDVSKLPGNNDFERLFSETGAYLLEMTEADAATLADGTDVPHQVLGSVTDTGNLVIHGASGTLRIAGAELTESWAESFARVLE